MLYTIDSQSVCCRIRINEKFSFRYGIYIRYGLLSNADMLTYQLDKFHEILGKYANHKGQKIVFIHGKGDGVLRKAIEKELKTRYKQYYYQDASFREYGFGATMVTIK